MWAKLKDWSKLGVLIAFTLAWSSTVHLHVSTSFPSLSNDNDDAAYANDIYLCFYQTSQLNMILASHWREKNVKEDCNWLSQYYIVKYYKL